MGWRETGHNRVRPTALRIIRANPVLATGSAPPIPSKGPQGNGIANCTLRTQAAACERGEGSRQPEQDRAAPLAGGEYSAKYYGIRGGLTVVSVQQPEHPDGNPCAAPDFDVGHGEVAVGDVLDLPEALFAAADLEAPAPIDKHVAGWRVLKRVPLAHLVDEESLAER